MTKTKTQFNSHRNLALTVALVVVFCLGNSFGILRAQQPATPATNPTNAQINIVCQAEMQTYAAQQLKDFRQFITTNFQNKSSTSSLTGIAIARYKQMRTAMYNKYNTYFAQEGALMLTEAVEPGACMEIVDDTLSLARRELGQRAVQTATVKKTTALIDKYQKINDQLGTLNLTFLHMKGYLDTFSAKIPCYISKSCNKG